MNENNPMEYTFVIKLKHKLDIQDASIYVLRHQSNGKNYKDLIIAYKMIYMNTYNVNVVDISNISEGKEM